MGVCGSLVPFFLSPLPVRAPACQRPATCQQQRAVNMAISRSNFDPSVYLVTDRGISDGSTVEDIVSSAIKGDGGANGVSFVQLRDKNTTAKQSLELGQNLRKITREAGVAFVVNDNIELAATLLADGVHLGQEDDSLQEARAKLGKEAIIGISAGTKEEAAAAIADGADYLGVGAVFSTTSKQDAGEPIGVDGLAEMVRFVNGRVPVVGIGGINLGNARFCAEAGADGIAVISAIMTADDPGREAGELCKIMRSVRGL